jgi:S1-C subfamily serine protease
MGLPTIIGHGILICLLPAPVTGQDWTATVAKVQPALLKLTTSSGAVCTAVHVQPGLVLTSEHCVPRAVAASVRVNEAPARVVKRGNRLALLAISEAAGPTLSLRTGSAPVGLPILIAGHAFDTPLKFTFGWISGEDHFPGSDEPATYINLPILHGFSGGPIVDQAGLIVGVAESKWAEGIGVAIPLTTIRAFLADLTLAQRKAPLDTNE